MLGSDRADSITLVPIAKHVWLLVVTSCHAGH
jgi:hypothetical protein